MKLLERVGGKKEKRDHTVDRSSRRGQMDEKKQKRAKIKNRSENRLNLESIISSGPGPGMPSQGREQQGDLGDVDRQYDGGVNGCG